MLPLLTCPLDQQPLTQDGKQLRCPEGHSFDIAKQGYVNLLPVQHKKSKNPGDDKAMVLARHQFLNQGHYQVIVDTLLSALRPLLSEHSLIIDAGCGEGYYLNALAQQLNFEAIGYDISKQAVLEAAKHNKDITWLVCSNKQPPIQAQQCDILLSMFGFPDFSTFQKLLKPTGFLVMVEPGENHLIEIREMIYPSITQKEKKNRYSDCFKDVETRSAQTQLTLSQQALQPLLLMTPHLHRATTEGKAALAATPSLTVTVDVTCQVLQPIS
ncbi:MAG: methyltransferase domain-containing protein [Methylococcales bacterium]|jgi:23S rRNA (guanine745-N1)-methyltransferase|nr:methyltransferase domain-containing protein [Methylococcales bacterium]MBT7445884.1 methyltransferase domain-containing protein [Methylococcales bacterium]